MSSETTQKAPMSADGEPEGDSVRSIGPITKDHALVFNRNATLALLGISGLYFARLVRDGAPVVSNGGDDGWKIHLPSFVRFLIDDLKKGAKGLKAGQMSYDDARRKDKEVQANIRELELMKLEGELVEIESIRPFMRDVLSTTRSRMLSVTSQVIGLTPSQQRDLQDAINDALSELSEGRVGEWNQNAEQAGKLAHH